MSLRVKKNVVLSVLFILPLLIVVSGCFLYPPEIRYNSYLAPNIKENDQQKSIDKDTGGVVFDIGGSSVVVRSVPEVELNALFPEESKQGKYSTNPFTYGNWIDPDLGYTPNRFTVFSVTIINRVFPKMRLDPREALLITDTGEVLHSYTVNVASARYGKSFENYYRSILGQSGNDFYRYEMRLGMVRGKNFGLEEDIFRGDSYSGLIAFDALRPEIKRVQLVFNKVVYRFDAFNRPSDTVDIQLNWDRKIDRVEVTREMRQAELEKEKVRIKFSGTQQMVGARTNDSARSPRAIDRGLEATSAGMEKCFIERYRKGEVIPGKMTLSFTIDPNGAITSQNVTEVSGINSETFMNCVLEVVKTATFEKIEDLPTEGTNIIKGPARPVNVTYPLEFSVVSSDSVKAK
jgi:hypothetical protein